MSKKIAKWALRGLALLLVLGTSVPAIALMVRGDRTFAAPYPAIRASRDPQVIARGQYLATGAAHCVDCHADPAAQAGPDAPLSGGLRFDLPFGPVYVPNITADPQTGIGGRSDGEIARLLRHGVHPSGRAMLPFMPFANMSDADLTAVISYLRTLAPVRHEVPALDPNLLGKLVQAFILEPSGPASPPPRDAPGGATIARGRYLAHDVANCVGCHTQRDRRTGAFTGPAFAGGMEIGSHRQPGASFVSPNLTPDPASGRINAWSEDAFVQRFRLSPQTPSPMPWGSFARMSDDDLRALYRYLKSLPAARMPAQEP